MEVATIHPTRESGLYKRVEKKLDEIKALNVPVWVIPAPGDGLSIKINYAAAKWLPNGTGMTGANSGLILQHVVANSSIMSVLDAFLEETATHKTHFAPTQYGGNPVIIHNEGVELIAANEFTGGDAAAKLVVEVWYDIVPF